MPKAEKKRHEFSSPFRHGSLSLPHVLDMYICIYRYTYIYIQHNVTKCDNCNRLNYVLSLIGFFE